MKDKKPTSTVRSVRVTDQSWEAARRRAEYGGVTISHVAALLIEGFANGEVPLPTTSVNYGKQKKADK